MLMNRHHYSFQRGNIVVRRKQFVGCSLSHIPEFKYINTNIEKPEVGQRPTRDRLTRQGP